MEIWDLSLRLIVGFRVGKLGNYMFVHSRNKGKLSEGHVNDNDVHSSDKVCSSAHNYVCVVNDSVARTAYLIIIIIIIIYNTYI